MAKLHYVEDADAWDWCGAAWRGALSSRGVSLSITDCSSGRGGTGMEQRGAEITRSIFVCHGLQLWSGKDWCGAACRGALISRGVSLFVCSSHTELAENRNESSRQKLKLWSSPKTRKRVILNFFSCSPNIPHKDVGISLYTNCSSMRGDCEYRISGIIISDYHR